MPRRVNKTKSCFGGLMEFFACTKQKKKSRVNISVDDNSGGNFQNNENINPNENSANGIHNSDPPTSPKRRIRVETKVMAEDLEVIFL
jgi:hypothetical protein